MGKNFKIRINAALALAVISAREHYGSHFCEVSFLLLLLITIHCCMVSIDGTKIVRAVAEGLENMEEIEDFSEFKYKENLHVQVLFYFFFFYFFL